MITATARATCATAFTMTLGACNGMANEMANERCCERAMLEWRP
jgi:hypothetical protein